MPLAQRPGRLDGATAPASSVHPPALSARAHQVHAGDRRRSYIPNSNRATSKQKGLAIDGNLGSTLRSMER